MGLLGASMDSLSISSKTRRSSDASAMSAGGGGGGGAGSGSAPEGNENDTSELDQDQGNVLTAIISQLRPGMDLSKIALPTFVLEPRSLLERITDFFSHPDLIFGAEKIDDEKERFIKVATYYLSGWHIKPKGVKKPYNPVLGEFFRCVYHYEDGSKGYYVAEQVSHHPPVSAFFYISPQNGLIITGELKPKSKFLGNSAATIMEGEDRMRFLDRPEDGDYVITMPNTYARGILFGKMVLELGDVSTIRNDQTGYSCDVEFRTKGWISGGYNAISGRVNGPSHSHVGDISGHWHDVIDYSDKKKGKKTTVFDARKAKNAAKFTLAEEEQEENESRRLWRNLTEAIRKADMHGATAAKTAVEDRQRQIARERESAGEGLPPSRFFNHVAGDKWMPKLLDNLPTDRKDMEQAAQKWFFGDKPIPGPGSGTRAPSSPANMTSSDSRSRAGTTTSAAGSAPSSRSRADTTVSTASSSSTATFGTAPSSPMVSATSRTQPVPSDAISGGSTTGSAPPPPPATTTAPGPPAPGPKFSKPVA